MLSSLSFKSSPHQSLLLVLLTLFPVGADQTDRIGDSRTALARRIDHLAPHVDGVLDDAMWQQAARHEDFQQSDPVEGAVASEQTSFQILYDEEALFVGVRCFDSNAAGIISRLTRRDDDIEADWVSISLDPHHDRQSGAWFKVFASGSVGDGVYSADRSRDDSWDSIWEVATTVDDSGWTAEFRIPYHALRFSPQEAYTWGLNVERRISRKHESAHWSLMRRDRPGLVSQFGQLHGIAAIHPPLHMEVIPYSMGRSILDNGTDYSGAAGADLRYGISSGVSLNATMNPDFGQVEADPATLNLTAFEDFFDERRPFFVEGASIFNSSDYRLFHSRRIGRRPGLLDVPDSVDVLSEPDATTILGAVKLTGKTTGKTSFGLLGAVTDNEYARVSDSLDASRITDFRVEPRTGYLVARAQQDVLDGTSTVGAILTTTRRDGAHSAHTGALDWDLRFAEDRWAISGSVVGSRTGPTGDTKQGYIAHLELDKRGGWLEAETRLAALSPGVDLNDLGFLRRGDLIEWSTSARGFHLQPWGPFLRWNLSADGEVAWNYDNTRLQTSSNLSFWGDTPTGGRMHLHMGREFASMDDSDVRRDGPIIERLAEFWLHSVYESDPGRTVSFRVRPDVRRTDGGGSWSRSLSLGVEYRPLPSLWLSVAPSYERRRTDAQWVDRIDDGVMPHFVYGELDSRIFDLSTRGRVSFTPDLSVELFLQPFVAIGDFRRFKELVEPETYRFVDYDLGENRDFHRRSLKSNLVLRWEFRPGSQLYIVWAQSRSESIDAPDGADLELRPLRRLVDAFTDEGSNVFLTKINYWIPL
jgi:hypothetical protein